MWPGTRAARVYRINQMIFTAMFPPFVSGRRLATVLSVWAVFGLVTGNPTSHRAYGWQADETPLTAEQVRESIERGINFLKRSQQANGTWQPVGYHRGGVTALATLALLTAGVPPQDPTVRRSLEFLDGLELDVSTIYTVSLMTMVYCQAAPEMRRARIRECAEHLARGQYKAGGRDGNWEGGWTYRMREAHPSGSRPDGSNSQFALLALHEAALIGIEVDPAIWQRSRVFWNSLRDQTTGGFSYMQSLETGGPTGSMTCGAISSLIIIDEHLPGPVPLVNGRIQCCRQEDELPAVESASRWIAKRFAVSRNPSQNNSQTFARDFLYYLYGMERAARLSGQRFFGTHDWYREGTSFWSGCSTPAAPGKVRPCTAKAIRTWPPPSRCCSCPRENGPS